MCNRPKVVRDVLTPFPPPLHCWTSASICNVHVNIGNMSNAEMRARSSYMKKLTPGGVDVPRIKSVGIVDACDWQWIRCSDKLHWFVTWLWGPSSQPGSYYDYDRKCKECQSMSISFVWKQIGLNNLQSTSEQADSTSSRSPGFRVGFSRSVDSTKFHKYMTVMEVFQDMGNNFFRSLLGSCPFPAAFSRMRKPRKPEAGAWHQLPFDVATYKLVESKRQLVSIVSYWRVLSPSSKYWKIMIMKTPVDGSSINTIVFHGVCCRRAIAFSFCLLCFLALKCNLHGTGRSQSACSSGRKWRKKLWMGTKLTVQQCKRVDVIAPAWGGALAMGACFFCLLVMLFQWHIGAYTV